MVLTTYHNLRMPCHTLIIIYNVPAIVVAADPMPCDALANNNGTKDSAAANTMNRNRK